MIASKIIDLTQIICASPDYLARYGRPRTPADLAFASLPDPQRHSGADTLDVQRQGMAM